MKAKFINLIKQRNFD